jgi:hypothetical protein
MTFVDTKYGIIKDIAFEEYYQCGDVKRCVVREKNQISLNCGTFIPQFKDDGKRKKLNKSITFYENGNISGMILQDSASVTTVVGELPAEMVTFYESGAIKRLFPVFGSVNGFWTENDEYRISPQIQFDLPFGSFNGKVINIAFYETGEFKSVTLWPKDSFVVKTPVGEINSRIGFCLYPDGAIRSVEPRDTVSVETPVGFLPAYDPDALGIDGDSNSLVFANYGGVESLLTSKAQITVKYQGKEYIHMPTFKKSNYFDDRLAVEPMKISFSNGFVRFGKRKSNNPDAEYKISECSFKIGTFDTQNCFNTCDDCL